MSASPSKTEKNNLIRFIKAAGDILNLFESQPLHMDRRSAQIQPKYPKFLSTQSLLDFQLNDYMFRETFVI